MKKPEQKSFADLENEIASITSFQKSESERADRWKAAHDKNKSALDETLKEVADLKERLVTAESENQRMRGYIQRVQEDDVAREELVTIGEPGGDQTLVPKRTHTLFPRPSDHSPSGVMGVDMAYDARGERRRPRHWVRYGHAR